MVGQCGSMGCSLETPALLYTVFLPAALHPSQDLQVSGHSRFLSGPVLQEEDNTQNQEIYNNLFVILLNCPFTVEIRALCKLKKYEKLLQHHNDILNYSII